MDISKVKPTAAMSFVLGALNLSVCLTHIYLFDKEFFLKIDLIKLIILGMGILSVFFAIAFVVVLIFEGGAKLDNTKDEFDKVGLSTISFVASLLMLIPAAATLVIKHLWNGLSAFGILLGYAILFALLTFMIVKYGSDGRGEKIDEKAD